VLSGPANAVIARTRNAAQPQAIPYCSGGIRRVTWAAFAVALLIGGGAWVAQGAPSTCADVQKSIEKRLADAGVQHPPLKIVPKNLSTGYRVVGTCEGGTQRIVHDVVAASSPNNAHTASHPRSASNKP
jgi:hypothetical protein